MSHPITPSGDGPPDETPSWPSQPSTSGSPTYGQPAPGQNIYGQPVSDSSQPTYGQSGSDSGQPTYGQTGSDSSQPTYGQTGPDSGQSSYGQTGASQPAYGQPAYGATPGWGDPASPYGQPPYGGGPLEPQKPNGLAIAAMVLGILAVPGSLFPIVGPVLAIVALILGIIALRRRRGRRGMAITGIVLGAIFLVVGVLITIFWYIAYTVASDCYDETGETSGPAFEQCVDDRANDVTS